jgi:hypothetical protein
MPIVPRNIGLQFHFLTRKRSLSDALTHSLLPLDQWWYLRRYRNLQYRRLGFVPGLDRRLLDRLKVVEAGGIAPIPFRNRDNVKARDVEARNSRRLLQYGEGFENAIFVVLWHDDQNRKTQLRRRP